MPTEHQWEYAAKGGTKSSGYKGEETDKYFLYPGSDTVGDVAWYSGNSEGRTHEVGKQKENELGLYDMGGNVFEWCFDLYTDTSVNRVLRGGSCGSSATDVRSAYRVYYGPYDRNGGIGFRLLRP